MNKAELIDTIAKETDLSKVAAGRALDALLNTLVNAVASNDTVTLVGFGTFKQNQRAARTGRNPRTGEQLKIAASIVPRFSPGSEFKMVVNIDAGKKAKKQ